ncbi:P-loop containing nucleoside triphosphate hydrolase protein [Melanogaster broomeanus]|nr:P-loop containing nucleoside triphosphate hydrolase protein [Melanogaster broomeanus]
MLSVNGQLGRMNMMSLTSFSHTGFLSSAPTFAVQKIGADTLLQVHPTRYPTCRRTGALTSGGSLSTAQINSQVDAAVVRNVDVLNIVAEFLGVQPSALESTLSYKTEMVKKELCTVFLNAAGVSDNRDDLAKTLYSLLFTWLNEHINQRLCRDDFDTFIGLFDLPGPQNMTSLPNSLDQFCVNFANKLLHSFVQKCIFEAQVDEYQTEGISHFVPTLPYFDNAKCVQLLQNKPAFGKHWGNHLSFKIGTLDRSGFPTFTVNHFNGPIAYSAEGFLNRNLDALNPDFVSLHGSSTNMSDGMEGAGSINPFVKGIFLGKAIATQAHPKNEDTIVSAQQTVKPMRAPSMHCKGTPPIKHIPTLCEDSVVKEQDRDEEDPPNVNSEPHLTHCLTRSWICKTGLFSVSIPMIHSYRMRSLGLPEIAKRNVNMFEVGMMPDEFCGREKVERTREMLGLKEFELVVGQYKVFLSQAAFHSLEDHICSLDVKEQKRNCLRDAEAEAGVDVHSIGDPYAPYPSPGFPEEDSPYADAFNQELSQAHVPLMSNTSPFQCADLYDDEYDERKSFQSHFSHHRNETS